MQPVAVAPILHFCHFLYESGQRHKKFTQPRVFLKVYCVTNLLEQIMYIETNICFFFKSVFFKSVF